MNLSPQEIQHLLTTFPDFEYIRPLSVHPSDSPIQRVRVLPLQLAQQIKLEDPHEDVFHIEEFPAHGRADLWSTVAWRESLSRQLKLKASQKAADPTTPLLDQLHSIEAEIITYLIQTVHLPTRIAIVGAETITRNTLTKDQEAFIQIITLPQELLDRLTTVKNSLALIYANRSGAADPNPSVEPSNSTGQDLVNQDQAGVQQP